VLTKGQTTFAVTVAALGKDSAESVLPLALDLACKIAARLPRVGSN